MIAYDFAENGDAIRGGLRCDLVGSLLVSDTRARAEALGVERKVGIATRPVRVVRLSIGSVSAVGELINEVDRLPPRSTRRPG